MTELIKAFKNVADKFFGKKVDVVSLKVDTVYKTRSQIIAEGKGAYIPKRHMYKS